MINLKKKLYLKYGNLLNSGATLKKLFSSRELLAKRTNDYEQVCKGINRLQPRIKSAYEIQYFVSTYFSVEFNRNISPIF